MDYSARSQMNSVNDHMSYTEDINYIIDSKLLVSLYSPYNMGCQIGTPRWLSDLIAI
jgi:hypothetical protein